jgi:DNA-binding MurR/RpiR family transcriptional regulator
VVSRSGEGEVPLKFVELAHDHGALTALITGDPGSSLAAAVDVPLHTGTGTGSSWTDYFAGRSSDSLVGALLWALVAQRVPDRIYDRMGHSDGPGAAARNQDFFNDTMH